MGGHALDTGVRRALLALAWLGGSALQMQRAEVAPPAWGFALAAAALVLAWWQRRRLPLAALALVVAAFALAEGRAAVRLAEALPPALEGRDLELTAVVAGLPVHGPLGWRFVLDVEQAPRGVPPRLSMAWYATSGDAALPVLRPGQRWRFDVRLKRPHGSLNPHGFDLELWLFERGLRAGGYVRGDARLLGVAPGYAVARARQGVRDAIVQRLGDTRAAGVLVALAVGDQAAIDDDDWDLFRATGVAHLMSISGLHVTMFAWLAAGLVSAVWRRSARLTLWLPAPQAARWGGLALAAAYAVFAGFGVPAQRTLAMLAIVIGLRSAGLNWPSALVLLAAAVGVTLLDPWALLQPGFWLSFGAVGLLMVGSPALVGGSWRQRLRHALRKQMVASVGLAPLTLVCFQQVSVVGFVANVVAIPVVTLAVTPLALAGVVVPWAWDLGASMMEALSLLLAWLADLPWAVWNAPAAPWWAAAAGLAGGTLLLLPIPWRKRLLGLPMLLPLLFPTLDRPAPGRFELLAADVGQGTAVLVRTRSHLLLYDTGPRYSPEADAGDRVLLPLLRARGERQVDLLVLSHGDSDHIGGAASVLASVAVHAGIGSLPAGHELAALVPAYRRCAAGQRWTWDGVGFEVLYPPAGAAPASHPNASSCVLRVQDDRGRSVLLTADLEAPQETALVFADKAALASTVLMVPHHGSRTSSSAAFIDAVAPRIAFVQAAYRSRYGHPAPQVLARYAERGIEVRRSDTCGAWTWSGDGEGTCERQARRRYWRDSDRADAASAARP